jgi:hypothetical protein
MRHMLHYNSYSFPHVPEGPTITYVGPNLFSESRLVIWIDVVTRFGVRSMAIVLFDDERLGYLRIRERET